MKRIRQMKALLVRWNEKTVQPMAGVLTDAIDCQHMACTTIADAMRIASKQEIEVVYADLRLGDGSGIELCRKLKALNPQIYVIVGMKEGAAEDVITAMRAGASDVIIDPEQTELVVSAFERAGEKVHQAEPVDARKDDESKAFITQDEKLLRVLDTARKVAASRATVLITGESGTGKELLAAFVHASSDRNQEPYIAVNCAALPEQLADSELFGHEKGAFTGAISRKIGKFEGAGKGTLVLDEVTEMDLPLQAKLLRALQEREVVRIGSNRSIAVHARVVAISNQVMKEAVAAGRFREDLYYRLNVIPLTIPPLRERKNDIPILAKAFLDRFSRQNGKKMEDISPDAMDLLIRQNWPGNVRELENAIERGVLIGDGATLHTQDLLFDQGGQSPGQTHPIAVGKTVREMERELITNTLQSVNDNRTHAAKMLGISIRTLRNKLNEYRSEVAATE